MKHERKAKAKPSAHPQAQSASKIEDHDPRELLLDPFNPRLAPGDKGKSQKDLIDVMLERFAIDEIAESICSAGFLPLDPFVGYVDNRKTYILEGNRRLAAIKLLLDPTLTPVRYMKTWDSFRKRLSADSAQRMGIIPVRVYEDRRNVDVLAYIGYRHVNGILNWDSEEKAAFIAGLLEDGGINWGYEDVARKIGSRSSHVEKLYVAHRVVEQAIEREAPGAENMRGLFGVLTRALQSPGIIKFLGISFPHNPLKSRQPCTTGDQNLQDFVRWTFGTEDAKAVLEDSRDLTKWGQVLASKEAVRYLRNAVDPRFDRAFAKSGGPVAGLVDSLMAAADRLTDAVPLVRAHASDVDVKNAVSHCTDYMVQILRYFPDVARKQGVELSNDTAT